MKKILASKPVKFLNGGVILKVFSFSLNYLLADLMQLHVEMTYAFVLICDFLLGFVINRYFVFNDSKNRSNKQTFALFAVAGLGFRFINWVLYSLIVNYLGIYILTAQLIATLIVLCMKYFVYKVIFK